ncbi:MAG: biotin--[acetyl-CoA-carboxylase] ligase [Synechococcaceae cyanobacterium]
MIGRISAHRRRLGGGASLPHWQLRWCPVCASTEQELDRWLATPDTPERLQRPRVVLAARQRFGHGQRGRVWLSPAGGVWLSAALPWPGPPLQVASPGLAAAVALARELDGLGLPVRLKWPNDLLLLDGAGPPLKLAGLLPRLRQRGSTVRWARLGLGLNGCNRVPAGATALAGRIGPLLARPERLAPLVLRSLEVAMALAGQRELVRRAAEALLWLPSEPVAYRSKLWQPLGLDGSGGLRLADGTRTTVLERDF